jgi:hypothetical protein
LSFSETPLWNVFDPPPPEDSKIIFSHAHSNPQRLNCVTVDRNTTGVSFLYEENGFCDGILQIYAHSKSCPSIPNPNFPRRSLAPIIGNKYLSWHYFPLESGEIFDQVWITMPWPKHNYLAQTILVYNSSFGFFSYPFQIHLCPPI